MNLDTEVEKLNIDERKIIHILLKQLMYQQNEMAYIRNKAGLNMYDNSIAGKRDGSKTLSEGIAAKRDGSKTLSEGIAEKRDGSKTLSEGIAGKRDGSKTLSEGIVEKRDGSKTLTEGIVGKRDGSKTLFGGIAGNEGAGNGDVWLYTVFEQELIEALEQYIKNGNGQNSLYGFYTDFEDAVEQENAAATKLKETEKDLKLENTHVLPTEIMVDNEAVWMLTNTLRAYVPKSSNRDSYKNIANELLLLHNIGKATATQLREAAAMSVGGIAKHLPKLQRAGFIKKQPPGNYALTEKSKHILLETFGVAKSK